MSETTRTAVRSGNSRQSKPKIARKPGIDPKVHGSIPDVPVLSTFTSRRECSEAGVHAPLSAGIHGSNLQPAYSIVMSGGYEDDDDKGETFIYTGEGTRGRATTETAAGKRCQTMGDQVKDQEWKNGNKSLHFSQLSGKPVRVVRGFSLQSRYAPAEGYRYDGLYKVTNATRAVGKSGFKTCQFTFERLPGQPPLPNEELRPAKRRKMSETPVAGPSRTARETVSVRTPEIKREPKSELIPTKPYNSFMKRKRSDDEQ
ncbi:PUA-like domain-containing protein [Mycena galericulata]|nr:PUA-like domain-containing protein [Mycena galericulata]